MSDTAPRRVVAPLKYGIPLAVHEIHGDGGEVGWLSRGVFHALQVPRSRGTFVAFSTFRINTLNPILICEQVSWILS